MMAFALAMSLITGQPGADTVAGELTQIERQLATAWKSGDCDSWSANIAPEWSVIHITGEVLTRSEALQLCRKPPAPIDTLTSDELTVRAFGDAAVVTGRTMAATKGNSAEKVTLRFTDVFIRRDGRWQIVASHATRVAP